MGEHLDSCHLTFQTLLTHCIHSVQYCFPFFIATIAFAGPSSHTDRLIHTTIITENRFRMAQKKMAGYADILWQVCAVDLTLLQSSDF